MRLGGRWWVSLFISPPPPKPKREGRFEEGLGKKLVGHNFVKYCLATYLNFLGVRCGGGGEADSLRNAD